MKNGKAFNLETFGSDDEIEGGKRIAIRTGGGGERIIISKAPDIFE